MGDYSPPSALTHPNPTGEPDGEKNGAVVQAILDFMSTQEEAVLTYRASNMVLPIHSDASYLSEPKSRSRAGGHMFMAGKDKIPINNEAVLDISQIIWAIIVGGIRSGQSRCSYSSVDSR